MGEGYLIDSNVLIDYLNGKLSLRGTTLLREVVNQIPTLSFISKIEVLSFKNEGTAEKLLQDFIDNSNIIEITPQIIDTTIQIRKLKKIKVPDAIIAATAVALKLTLLTRNVADFKNIPDLAIVNPWD